MSAEIIDNEFGRWELCDCCGHENWEPVVHGPHPRPPAWAGLIPDVYNRAVLRELSSQPLLRRLG